MQFVVFNSSVYFQLFMSSVDRCSHDRAQTAQVLLELLSIRAGVCSFNTDPFSNDLDTFIDAGN